MTITLYKLGGSLLQCVDFLPKFNTLLDAAPKQSLFLVGGGETVDLVRKWDLQFDLGDEPAHHLAIEAMRLNALLLMSLSSRLRLCDSQHQAEASWQQHTFPLLDVVALRDQTSNAGSENESCLPMTWETTSDAIALDFAIRWDVESLVLVKSAPLADGLTAKETATQGLVDPVFPRLLRDALKLNVKWCNFLSDPACQTAAFAAEKNGS